MDDLTELDREVAEIIGSKVYGHEGALFLAGTTNRFHPTSNPAQAMELLREFTLDVGPHNLEWLACTQCRSIDGQGSTPEIAICRAVVSAKKGKE